MAHYVLIFHMAIWLFKTREDVKETERAITNLGGPEVKETKDLNEDLLKLKAKLHRQIWVEGGFALLLTIGTIAAAVNGVFSGKAESDSAKTSVTQVSGDTSGAPAAKAPTAEPKAKPEAVPPKKDSLLDKLEQFLRRYAGSAGTKDALREAGTNGLDRELMATIDRWSEEMSFGQEHLDKNHPEILFTTFFKDNLVPKTSAIADAYKTFLKDDEFFVDTKEPMFGSRSADAVTRESWLRQQALPSYEVKKRTLHLPVPFFGATPLVPGQVQTPTILQMMALQLATADATYYLSASNFAARDRLGELIRTQLLGQTPAYAFMLDLKRLTKKGPPSPEEVVKVLDKYAPTAGIKGYDDPNSEARKAENPRIAYILAQCAASSIDPTLDIGEAKAALDSIIENPGKYLK